MQLNPGPRLSGAGGRGGMQQLKETSGTVTPSDERGGKDTCFFFFVLAVETRLRCFFFPFFFFLILLLENNSRYSVGI